MGVGGAPSLKTELEMKPYQNRRIAQKEVPEYIRVEDGVPVLPLSTLPPGEEVPPMLRAFQMAGHSVTAAAFRASLRSCGWRAKARLRTWRAEGMMDVLRGDTRLGKARRGLLDLSADDIHAFIDQQTTQSQEVVAVAGAVCILLGVKPSWKYTKRVLDEPDTIDYFARLSLDDVPDDARALARGLLIPVKASISLTKVMLGPAHAGGRHGQPAHAAIKQRSMKFVQRFWQWGMAFTEGVEAVTRGDA